MNVIDLDERRRPAADPEPGYACRCGEAWFELRDGPPAAPHGAVVLGRDGSVTGYAGVPHCVSCGTPAAGYA